MPYRILCVDSEEGAREETIESLRAALTDLDLVFEQADTVADAEQTLTQDTAAIITEYTLPDGTGFDLIDTAREKCPNAGCILYTDTDPETIDTTELQGAITEYVGKGSLFGAERLSELLRTTIETKAQASYPLPQNEDERLAALQAYDLDNPELVASLDRITDLAATHFDVERASVNIINEHSQDFLACYGDTKTWDSMEREDSICTFTILEDDNVMAVEDVTEDPRFESRSETLIEFGIHSYLGANLVTTSGLTIGPLCIYDTEPRSFSEADKSYLQDLASVAMDLIEVHAQVDAIATTSEEQQ